VEEGGDAFLADIEPDPPALVDGLIPEGGKTLLVGGAKTGKTALLLNLAWSVAAGTPFLGHTVARPRRVLMVDLELSRRGMQQRLSAMREAREDNVPGSLRLTLLRGHPQYRDWTRLRSLIERMHKEHGPYDLITIDCLYRLQPGKDENDSSEMSKVGVELDRIHASTQAAIALLHHTPKPSAQAQDPVNMGRGSSILGGEMDAVMAVYPHVQEHHAILKAELRDYKRPAPAVYSMSDWPLARLAPSKEPEIRKPGADPEPATQDDGIRVVSPW
jgi:RecA-family ATPase